MLKMLFPKFAEGLEAVLFIALNAGADPVSSRQICSYQNVLPRHLEPVLQTLVKEGILKGIKGPRGGYILAREKRKICIGEIFSTLSKEAIQADENTKETNSIRQHITNKIKSDIIKNTELHLKHLTIDDLCKQVAAKLKKGGKPDFCI